MAVKRIVADFLTADIQASQEFYKTLFELDILMDQGWVTTLGYPDLSPTQITFATSGGSGAPMPDLSIEVDDLDHVIDKAHSEGVAIIYGPVTEPWGVRRFFVRDPNRKIINVLSHLS